MKRSLLIILEGLKAHRSRLVRKCLDSLAELNQIAFLPPYTPDLNPVEHLWAWLRRNALASYCPNDLRELHVTAQQTHKRQQASPDHRRLLDAGYALVMSLILDNLNTKGV